MLSDNGFSLKLTGDKKDHVEIIYYDKQFTKKYKNYKSAHGGLKRANERIDRIKDKGQKEILISLNGWSSYGNFGKGWEDRIERVFVYFTTDVLSLVRQNASKLDMSTSHYINEIMRNEGEL